MPRRPFCTCLSPGVAPLPHWTRLSPWDALADLPSFLLSPPGTKPCSKPCQALCWPPDLRPETGVLPPGPEPLLRLALARGEGRFPTLSCVPPVSRGP